MASYDAGEFLQGFLEEANEHLTNIQQNLLRLDDLQSQPVQSETEIIEQADRVGELFRSYHTLKGLAGMVGLQDGVVLSHAMESALRAIQNGEIPLDQPVIDRLLAGTRTLSQIVNSPAHPGQPAVSISADLRAVEQMLKPPGELPGGEAQPAAATPPLPPAEDQKSTGQDWSVVELLPELSGYPDVVKGLGELEQMKILAAVKERKSFALAVFTSSAERASRGENVDWVRQGLQDVAAIIKAVPSIVNGAIRFYFLLTSQQPLSADMPFVDEIIPLAAQLPGKAEPPPGQAQAYTSPAKVVRPSAVVRVELDRLDELINNASELIQLRARFAEGLAQLDQNPKQARRELQHTYQQLGRNLRDLRQAILRTRMVPLAETFNHMPLVVRDLARASQKEVRLRIEGETIEVDKLLVERLLDPLIHLVRNAITHGIESPEERARAGKLPQGTLLLRAVPEGDHILIDISDDGQGVDLQAISRRAIESGKLQAGQTIPVEEALDWLTRPGFSTRSAADLAAGRGIGLDVVQRMIRSFSGQLSMKTAPGRGTTFRLRLPLTLVIVDALIVQNGEDRYAIRRDDIERILEIQPRQIVRMEGAELLPRPEEGYYLLYRLRDLFSTRPGGSSSSASHAAAPGRTGEMGEIGLIISPNALQQEMTKTFQQPILLVDRVLTLQEIVVHPLTDPYLAQPGIGGTTELGDGRAILMIDIPSLLQLGPRLKAATTLQRGSEDA